MYRQVLRKHKSVAMSSLYCIVLLLIAGVACLTSSPSRIVEGATTTIQTYPSIVQVESTSTGLSWSQSCGGTILNSRFVLSAAQCFDGILYSNSRRRIRAGSASRERNGVVLAVSRVFHHPTYSSSTKNGDLTIVQTAAGWIWDPTIQPTQLVPQDFELPDYLPVILAGWGRTRSGLLGGGSSTLRDVTLVKDNLELCTEKYENFTSKVVTANMLCTMGEDEADSCDGDEGGPVFYRDVNQEMFLVGVISWRESCGNTFLPSVNTRIASYTNWIVINAA